MFIRGGGLRPPLRHPPTQDQGTHPDPPPLINIGGVGGTGAPPGPVYTPTPSHTCATFSWWEGGGKATANPNRHPTDQPTQAKMQNKGGVLDFLTHPTKPQCKTKGGSWTFDPPTQGIIIRGGGSQTFDPPTQADGPTQTPPPPLAIIPYKHCLEERQGAEAACVSKEIVGDHTLQSCCAIC